MKENEIVFDIHLTSKYILVFSSWRFSIKKMTTCSIFSRFDNVEYGELNLNSFLIQAKKAKIAI